MKFGCVEEAVLSDEVITEILSWLPVKPLLRFRCVCKFWKSLISNPHFLKLHLERSSRNANLILGLNTPSLFVGQSSYHSVMSCSKDSLLDNSIIDVQDDHHLLECKYEILGSCNGLVCLLASSRDFPIGKHWVRFWNPETRLKSKDSPPCLYRAFNTMFGFGFGYGYDKSSDTYKVVIAILNVTSGGFGENHAEVYTMGDCYWRDIQGFPAFPIQSFNEGKFLNGTLNWLAIRNTASSGSKQLVIVSFDLGKETCIQFSVPKGLDEIRIGVLGDCLCLFLDYKRTHFVVWQMKEFGVEKSWTQFMNISYQYLQFGGRFNFKPSALVPLYASENGDLLMLLYDCHEVILYNRRGNTVKRAKFRHRVWDAKDHVQSLIPPCLN